MPRQSKDPNARTKIFDMNETTSFNGWTRLNWFFYGSHVVVYNQNRRLGVIKRKLDFISYHLIRKIHGDKKLIQMAYDVERLLEEANV